MSLYPKKLSNIEELRREQAQLRKQLDKLSFEDVFSMDSLLGREKNTEKKESKVVAEAEETGGGKWDFVLELLPMAYPLLESVVNMAKDKFFGLFTAKPKQGKKGDTDGDSIARQGGSIVKTVALEILTGYLKWKAIELTYKGARHLIKKQQQKKALRKLEEEMG